MFVCSKGARENPKTVFSLFMKASGVCKEDYGLLKFWLACDRCWQDICGKMGMDHQGMQE